MENKYTPEREEAIRKHYEIEKIWLMFFVLFLIIMYDIENYNINELVSSYIFIAFIFIWLFGYGLWRFFDRKKLDLELNSRLEKWTGYIWFISILILMFIN